VLRSAWERWHGHEVSTEGDSFFVVFSNAGDALMAAIDGQRGLAAHAWPTDIQVRVRIGLHTGEPVLQEGDYFGMDVHRAARIASAAHGGQIVLSNETRGQIGAQLDSTLQLVDLGRRRLKDLVEPEHLFQVVADGLQREFPPLKSLGAATSLPMPPTPLVGRGGERRELEALLRLPDTRLVTLTGIGGSGKTRLAIALAAALVDGFADGVYFVALAAVTNAEAMWRAIGDALGVASDAPDQQRLVEVLRDRDVLLVLDNLEQLPDAAKVVNELLAASAGVVVLATSRRPLHLQGEHEHPVPPLDLPYDISMEEAERSGAIQLFVQQARLVRPGFELTIDNVASLAAICRRVDGLPLGIELAAARIKLLGPDALLARLDGATGLRARDVDRPTRQQTLHAAIAWSYDLLPPDLQRFFRHLGVFAGGADLDALDKITAPGADPLDMVADLVDASLVTVSEGPEGEPRIALLQTVSEYALEQLTAADELEAARRLHAEHYAAVAEEQAARLWSGSKQLSARDTLLVDLENITSAVSWALQQGAADADRGTLALRLAGSLWHFYGITSRIDEGRRWLDAALAMPGDQDPAVRARALSAAGTLAWRQGDYEAASEHHQEALRLQLQVGDVNGAAFSLNNLGVQASDQQDYERAVPLLERARGMSTEPRIRAIVLHNLAEAARGVGDHSCASGLLAECVQLSAGIGDEMLLGQATINLATVTLLSGDLPGAVGQYESALGRVRKLRDDSTSARYVLSLVPLCFATNQPEAAVRLHGAAMALHERIGEVVTEHDLQVTAPWLSDVRSSLGEHRFTELCREGSRLSADQALEEGQRVLGECGVEPVAEA
jgi:predicted ATPase